jgi:hypothetical protein
MSKRTIKVPMKRLITITDGVKTETYNMGRPIGRKRQGGVTRRFVIPAHAHGEWQAGQVSVNCGFMIGHVRPVKVVDVWKDGSETIVTF